MTNLEKVIFSGEELNEYTLSKLLNVDHTFISSCINNNTERLTHRELKNILLVIILLSHISGDIALAIEWFTSSVPVPGYGKTASEIVREGRTMSLIEYLSIQITAGSYA